MASLLETFLVDIKHVSDFVLTGTGDLATTEGFENLRNALFRRLITKPGALIHRPDYGCGILDYQNAPQTLDTQRNIARRIGEQFTRDPRVAEVTSVRVAYDPLVTSKTAIIVKVKAVGYDEQAMTFLPFLAGVS